MKTILSVVGARPNFMKLAPLHRALRNHTGVPWGNGAPRGPIELWDGRVAVRIADILSQ